MNPLSGVMRKSEKHRLKLHFRHRTWLSAAAACVLLALVAAAAALIDPAGLSSNLEHRNAAPSFHQRSERIGSAGTC